MTKPVRAVFFDVDGTLLSHETGGVPASATAALRQLRDQGIAVVVSTGRALSELDALGVDFPFHAYLLLNGQQCLDHGRHVFYDRPLEGDALAGVLALFNEREVPIYLIGADGLFLNFVDDRVRSAQAAISSDIPPVRGYAGEPIYMAGAYAHVADEPALRDRLRDVTITRWHKNGIDIVCAGAGKVQGVEAFLERTGIAADECVAFGDAENDIEMLRMVGTGVAMGNAEPDVKAVADLVTSDIDADGIANGLRALGLIT
ncbi:Cof-type HAD-IIB family hydrolase [Olsenella sp. YH-ols2217]|uniref:Cof-type HAD-IIB family hydrolase n=1 Tax=Kribbibacterium absianum TaxID=3044210 RepID=A0ABT6ZNE8_9ACTN|nr:MULTISPECIES: Cof-type HAD-IIB family hydrolase [unclassified Olsenella]MDJ1122257.1 Cof-type HAD-IIB family hydrolase [Olsenella sp. YH-ols2216]MDJ1130329.1 Cof-type HAD-IIB family hydrolase [Olsenella sp. YH-ols2217]